MIDARIISSKNVLCPMKSIWQGVDNYYKTFHRQVKHSIDIFCSMDYFHEDDLNDIWQ